MLQHKLVSHSKKKKKSKLLQNPTDRFVSHGENTHIR